MENHQSSLVGKYKMTLQEIDLRDPIEAAPVSHRVIARLIDSVISAILFLVTYLVIEQVWTGLIFSGFYLLLQDCLIVNKSIGKMLMGIRILSVRVKKRNTALMSFLRNLPLVGILFVLADVCIYLIEGKLCFFHVSYKPFLGGHIASLLLLWLEAGLLIFGKNPFRLGDILGGTAVVPDDRDYKEDEEDEEDQQADASGRTMTNDFLEFRSKPPERAQRLSSLTRIFHTKS